MLNRLIERLRESLALQRYSLLCLVRGNRSLLVVSILITTLVTAAQVFWREPLSDTLLVSTSETMGSLLAGFLGANLLDPELRLRTGELAFCKPYPAGKLIAGRVFLALLNVVFLIICNLLVVTHFRHLPHAWQALEAGLAPSLFLCNLACALLIASSNVILAYVGPILFWIWSMIGAPVGIRFDRLYNPILQISAWSSFLDSPSAATSETLIANELVLVILSALLFSWCCRRIRTASLQ